MNMAIDLFCGLGGWAEGFLMEGYDVIGFDIERHDYPGQLVIQDVLTLDGAKFKNATVIVASPPCQEFSYMAMPWSRAKQIARALRGEDNFPAGYKGSRTVTELTTLFDACFRIQREASEAAEHEIPLIVENVRGAIPWVGRSRWNFGSFHLWGDVPALMPWTLAAQKFNPDGTNHGQGSWFKVADSKNRGVKGIPHKPQGHWTNPAENGVKNGGDWFSGYGGGFGWDHSQMRQHSSKSPARKAASAKIAKIPAPLARHIARVFKGTPYDR